MTTEQPDYFDPSEPRPGPTKRPIDRAAEFLTDVARQAGFLLPDGLGAARLAPGRTPAGSRSYGERTGTWAEIEDFMAMWTRQGGTWVNIGWDVDERGDPFIAYETQWRDGDPEEPRSDGHVPDINLRGLPLGHQRPYFDAE